jgi:tetratricopeptide (TPR) repeat protein
VGLEVVAYSCPAEPSSENLASLSYFFSRMYVAELSSLPTTQESVHYSTVLQTANNLGVLYFNQGRIAEAEAMYRQALAGYEKALGPEHTSTLRTVNNLDVLYFNQGRIAETEVMYQQALMDYEKVLGPENTSALQIVKNLGILYNVQGRFAEAEVMYQRALVVYEKALGPEHTLTLQMVTTWATSIGTRERSTMQRPCTSGR